MILTKFYPDMRHGQASLGNGHFNCCAEMGELMLIYVRDVSWLIKLSLEWQLRNRFLTKFSIKSTNSLNSDLSIETSLFQDHLIRGRFPTLLVFGVLNGLYLNWCSKMKLLNFSFVEDLHVVDKKLLEMVVKQAFRPVAKFGKHPLHLWLVSMAAWTFWLVKRLAIQKMITNFA